MWADGTIAMLTVSVGGLCEGRAVRLVEGMAHPAWRMLDTGTTYTDRQVRNVRPLPVIDPGTIPMQELILHLRKAAENDAELTMALTWLADDMEAQTTPEKPSEPMRKYAAVVDRHGMEFVRLGDGPVAWMPNGSPVARGQTFRYEEIEAVEVLP